MHDKNLDESIEIIKDCLTQFYEDRNYMSYVINLPNMEKQVGYQEYREMLGLAKTKKVNVENIRKGADKALEDFKKAMKGGTNHG